MPTPPRIWTDAQRRAIRTTDLSLLVSAAAGSGKTAVLAERCAHLVCDAADECDVDELLVVTFTEAAAAEMRGRIQQALSDRIQSMSNPPARLLRQSALVEHAHISTIHAFCSRLLRQNFNAAGVDPQFQVIDADEAVLLRRDVVNELFDDRYEHDESGSFRQFIENYGDGRDDRLTDQVIHAYELLRSLESPRSWLKRSLTRLRDAADKPLAGSDLGRQLLTAVKTELHRLERLCTFSIAALKSLRGFAAYEARIKEWSSLITGWSDLFAQQGYDALVTEVNRFDPDSAPRMGKDVPNKDQAKSILDSVKDQIRKADLADLLMFTEDQWRAGQSAILPFAQVFFSLIDDFGLRYSAAKSQLRGVDFSDLERKALDLLRQRQGDQYVPSPLARACHRQYRHILVDEYQDVNEIQDEILRLVSAESVATEDQFPPNLFTVGDVKQSVYRFRLAEPRRFLDRAKQFRAKTNKIGQIIDLQENFRSRPPLLGAINEVFSRLMTEEAAEIEYDQTHHLRPSSMVQFAAHLEDQPRFSGTPIELHLLPRATAADDGDDPSDADLETVEIEAILCARCILQITGKDGSPPIWIDDHRANFSDIVILLRSMKFKSDDFARILTAHGIPVHNTGGSGFFAATEVRDMIALLNLLDNQQQDIPLAAFLRSPLARLDRPEDALATVRLAYPSKTTTDEEISFQKAVVRYATEKTDQLSANLRDLLSRLSRWRDAARQLPLADLIWQIYEETAALAYVSGLDNGPQRAANLLLLHERARKFGSFLKQGLHRFMNFLEKLRDESDLSQPSISDETQQAVRIMTIHHSKGLEFPIVILPDLGKGFNRSDSSGAILLDRRGGLGMSVVDPLKKIRYPSLSSMLTRASLQRQGLAEEMRLLYVAMTRAKEHLILIGTTDEKPPARWKSEYTGFSGPLPAAAILTARSMLDWIGPVQAACGETIIRLTQHSPEEVKSWPPGRIAPPDVSQRLQTMSALLPLEIAGMELTDSSVGHEANHKNPAESVIRRLQYIYPHQQATQLPAARAVTSLDSSHVVSPTQPTQSQFELPLPQFLAAQKTSLSPGEIGEATHLLLEHLDYRLPCDAPGLDAQIATLLIRHLLRPDQAAAIDRPALVWFASTELGQLLKSHAATLLREIPFACAQSTSSDPLDSVMIRGRIDLLLPTPAGLAVIDYKTDRIPPSAVESRAQTYRAQIETYRDALERVARQTVTAVHLVFLTPRIIWSSPA